MLWRFEWNTLQLASVVVQLEGKHWEFDLPFLQCDGLKMELQELQVLYDSSQRERAELEEELRRCRAELEKLSGGAQVRDGYA